MIKFKKGINFKKITPALDYLRLGKTSWEKLNKGESVELEPLKELIDKGYLIKDKKEKKEGK